MTTNVLSPERLCLFHEFIWRAMGNLHDSAWRDMLDPTTPLGAMVRADYAALAGGRHWDAMIEYLAPLGSDLLPENTCQPSAFTTPNAARRSAMAGPVRSIHECAGRKKSAVFPLRLKPLRTSALTCQVARAGIAAHVFSIRSSRTRCYAFAPFIRVVNESVVAAMGLVYHCMHCAGAKTRKA